MISAEFLKEFIRCPMDPERKTELIQEENALRCPRCGLRYPIKDGFPVLVVEEAELPPGVLTLSELPGKHA